MNARTRSAVRAAVAALGVAIAVTGCAATPATPTAPAVDDHDHEAAPARPAAPSAPAPVSPPTDPDADYGDPSTVCRAFTAALYSADTTRDSGPGDAYLRAAAYMNGVLAAQSEGAQRDGRWDTWRSHAARLETRVSDYADTHQDPDSTVTASRAQKVATTPVGADGWKGWTETNLIYCTLRHDGSGWRVSDYVIYPVADRG